jgi:TonB family protein
LDYPPEMFVAGIEGEVLLQGLVDSTGHVDPASVRVLRASNTAFEVPAIAMLRGTRFRPAQRNGQATTALIEVPISFELANVEIDSVGAREHLVRAERLIKRGRIDDAMADFTAAQRSDPRMASSTSFWFPLCWYGTLWERGKDVLSACDELIALVPNDAAARRASGMAKSVTGDYAGAIADFEVALRGPVDAGTARVLSDWIGELRAGRNPVTARVLESLRGPQP